MVNIDPILLVPLVGDLVMGIVIARQALHNKLGDFDIAYIVEPLGRTKEGDMYKVHSRVEFNPGSKKFRLGKGKNAETYRTEAPTENEINRVRKLNEKKTKNLAEVPELPNDKELTTDGVLPGPAFLQWTHRVWFFAKGKAYPISIGFGKPARPTTAKGADMYITQELHGQAVSHLRKVNNTLPISMAILCIVAGAGIAGMIFFALHPGFIPIGTQVVSQHTTATFTGTNSTSLVRSFAG